MDPIFICKKCGKEFRTDVWCKKHIAKCTGPKGSNVAVIGTVNFPIVDDIIEMILSYLLPQEMIGFAMSCKNGYRIVVECIKHICGTFDKKIFTKNYKDLVWRSCDLGYTHFVKVFYTNYLNIGKLTEATDEQITYVKRYHDNIDAFATFGDELFLGSCTSTACGKGNLDLVKYLLYISGDDVEDPGSILSCACESGNMELITFLLQYFPDHSINIIDALLLEGLSPEITRLIMKSPTSMVTSDSIVWASRSGNKEAVELLLRGECIGAEGSVVVVTERILGDALAEGARSGITEIVKILLANPRVNPRQRGYYALRQASLNGKSDVVKLFLDDHRVDDVPTLMDILKHPFTNDNFGMIKVLLTHKKILAIPAVSDVFGWAVMYNRYDLMKMLLSIEGLDPTYRNNRAMLKASSIGNTDMLKLLIDDPRVNPGAQKNKAIRLACSHGKYGVAKTLIKDKRVNPADMGNFALKSAIKKGYKSIVEILLLCNAVKTFVQTKNNKKKLMDLAIESGYGDVFAGFFK